MKYRELVEQVCLVNKNLGQSGLVTLTWGNASGVDRKAGVMAIKPSGVDYDQLTAEEMVVLSLEDGKVLAGELNPSSDTPTHLYLYQQFPSMGGVVHTHSTYATAWAQAKMELPCLGTTHADHFYGAVPVARELTQSEIASDYEKNTGVAIGDTLHEKGIVPDQIPAILMPGHGPFVWGETAGKALENAIVLEACARLAWLTGQLNADIRFSKDLLNKHFLRRHGPTAYYGQSTEEKK